MKAHRKDREITPGAQLSVLIANWNTCDLLRQCLQSIQQTVHTSPAETIVVDNGSMDGSAAMVRSEFPWVRLVDSPQNLGFGRANNQALQIAHGESILLLNPDTVLGPGAADGMHAYLQENSGVGAIGPRILNPDGSLQVSCSPRPTLGREAWRLFHLDRLYPLSRYSQERLHQGQPLEVDVLLGACLLLRRSVVEQIGLFDEQFFMYSEEVDLCLRIQQAGWRICWLPSVDVIHYGGQSTRQAADRMFLELYRNKVKYFRKHGGLLRARIYKVILYLAALARVIPGTLLGGIPYGRDHSWKTTANQYRKLMGELAEF
jgi:hypothetical protein